MQNWERNSTAAEAYPAYQFHSTSSYTPIVGSTSYTSEVYAPATTESPSAHTRPGIVRRDEWTFPDSEEIGVIYTPVGDSWLPLILAALYILLRKNKKIQEKFAQFKKKQ